ncbi:AraC family transcriptional regulator [Pantoea sp. GM01]|uniref:AraC family transcriptional regulator n=1 Tax=Pantoea sp. GM01 TaxID=1144320 RepID=UPI0002714AEC|nr:AraC family transcriptional regulator [Pantoea sp. GM01]EJL91399.1 DNA-binding domain-containing protein, AraC-type [Pantoea sp. GM01]
MGITAYRKIAGIEITLSDSTNHIFPKHSHDEFYIGANVSGREKIWLDGKNSEASVDEITIYNPGQIQAAEPTPYDWCYYSFYVSPESMIEFTGLDAEDHFKKNIFAAPDVAKEIRQVAAFALERHSLDAEINERVAGVLQSVLSRSGIHPLIDIKTTDKAIVDYVITRLMDDFHFPPSLQTLAHETGLSPVKLVRMFTSIKGLPPFAWIKGERLRQGKNMIIQGKPISEISAQLGFTDQAHFTRNFKSMFGVTPGQLYKLSL